MNTTQVAVAGLTLAMIMTGYAQEVQPNGPFGGDRDARRQEMRERATNRAGALRGGGRGGDEMMFRLIQDPQFAKEITLSDEKAQSLKDAFVKIQEKQIDLQAELSKANLQQAGQVAGLLADRKKNPDEALKLVEKIGKINIEISKLAVERCLAIRDNLTDEQIAKAKEVAKQRMDQMRERMMNRGQARMGGEGGAGGKGGDRRRAGDRQQAQPERRERAQE